MIEKYLGEKGRRLRLEALATQKIVVGAPDICEALEPHVEPLAIAAGDVLITQDADDNDVYFIFAGSFKVEINKRLIATRGRDDVVGEMAALDPGQKRSATLTALEDSIVAKISEENFSKVAGAHPQIYKFTARQLARRLLERNKHVGAHREKIKVFLISSVAALPIAYAVQECLEFDKHIEVKVWVNGVFKAGNTTIEDLEHEVDVSDFAIAVAHYDDKIVNDADEHKVVRDNVIFELGLFMGKLGRKRALLLEPRDEQLKLPTDLNGVTTFNYSMQKSSDLSIVLGPACNKMRRHFDEWGAYNG